MDMEDKKDWREIRRGIKRLLKALKACRPKKGDIFPLSEEEIEKRFAPSREALRDMMPAMERQLSKSCKLVFRNPDGTERVIVIPPIILEDEGS